MNYYMIGYSSSGSVRTKIAADEYNKIIHARNEFLEFLFLEEKFDLLMENYYEYEKEILRASLRYLVFPQDIHNLLQDARLAITRRLVNLLSTCRLYLDQSSHHISAALGENSKIKTAHESAKSEEYDSNFSYRLLEELRNHTQHRGYPFHVITFHSQLVEREPEAPVVTTSIPKLSIARLRDEGGFKKKVLDELAETGKDDIDLTPHIRSYIDSLQTIQAKLRKSTEQEVSESISVLRAARSLFELDGTEIDRETIWLLRFIEGSGDSEEDENFAYSSIEKYEEYLRKNSARTPLSYRFVSSRIVTPSA